jgi:2-oxoglutarate dehydrogenase E2 component (dihydrolipoamide succinyltransferase)
MSIEIKAPSFPESIADGTVATWHKPLGDEVSRDDLIVDIETDKVVLEILAPANGSLIEIIKAEGETVLSNELIAQFAEGDVSEATANASSEVEESTPSDSGLAEAPLGPAARKLVEENSLDPTVIKGTGKSGRVTKEDVVNHLKTKPQPVAPASTPVSNVQTLVNSTDTATVSPDMLGERVEKRVPMTRLRATIAKRLVSTQQNTAMLTTYNEVNMKPVMELRKKYRDLFEKTHNGTRLGFMSFFVKAATEALKRFPAVNASIDDNDMVYHGYQDIGIAVSTERGLVVPILRSTDGMGLADVEQGIADFAQRGRDGKLGIEDMQGGTFTITNGGIFGSLLSTPILNAPQTAILGMHKIQERPMVVNGEVVVLPMMYLALSYDHRMIDGKEAVQFLVTLKDFLEDPTRMLLDV